MRIGIVSALQEEMNFIKNELRLETQERVGIRDYYIGTLYNKEVVMAYTNCGKVSAATTITVLIERYQVDLIIFTGVAGGAGEEVEIGDVVIAEGMLQHDFDISKLINFPKYDNTLLGKSVFDVAPRYVSLLQSTADAYLKEEFFHEVSREAIEQFKLTKPKTIIGNIASGDQFIADEDKIDELKQGIPNLKCVDMESAAAAQICHEYKKDLLVFRIISDKADNHADISFDRFLNEVATIYSRGILRRLLKEL